MEAKNTVMDDKQVLDFYYKNRKKDISEKALLEAQAAITWNKAIKEVVERLEGWRKLGTHLVSDEAIQELRNLGDK